MNTESQLPEAREKRGKKGREREEKIGLNVLWRTHRELRKTERKEGYLYKRRKKKGSEGKKGLLA
jgi:hypothetical protein